MLGSTWVVKAASPGKAVGWISGIYIGDSNAVEQYLFALHWCFAQVTHAPFHVHAHNISERAFTIVVIAFSLLVVGSSVSKMSAAISQMNMANSEKARMKCQVKTWLRSERVSVTLAVRIARFVNHFLEHRGQCTLVPGLIPNEFLNDLLVTKLSRLLSGQGLFTTTHERKFQTSLGIYSRKCVVTPMVLM